MELNEKEVKKEHVHLLNHNRMEEILENDIISLLKKQPFYAYLLVKMLKRIDRSVPVAGVAVIDGDIVLYINPEGYIPLTKSERIAVLIHEVLHVILIHYLRRGDRDPSLFNVAADVAINQMVNTNEFKLPNFVLYPKHFNLPDDKSSEEYYKILWSRKDQVKMPQELQNSLGKMLNNCPSCGGSGQEQNDQNGQGQNPGDGDGEGEEEGQGQGQGQGEGHSHENSGKPCPTCGGSGKRKPGQGQGQGGPGGQGPKAPDFADLHPTWDRSTEVSEELAEAVVRSMVQDAYDKSQGDVPGNISELVQEILSSKINWRNIFRNFVAKRRHTTKKATWKRRNRRMGAETMGYRKGKRIHVAVFVDTSGSVGQEELQMFNGELQKMYQAGAEMTVIECDSQIQKVYQYTKHVEPEFRGRGGTDFRPPFEYIDKKNIRPDCIIYLTDGFGYAPAKCHYPVLWVLTPHSQRPMSDGGGEVPYGAAIVLED